MENKEELLKKLKDVYSGWEKVFAGMNELEIIGRQSPSALSVKDVLGHLRAWQQRSIAHLEGALHNSMPVFPAWSAKMKPDDEGDVDAYNAVIYQTYRDQPWSQVHGDWSAGFLHFLELAQAIDEEALFAVGRY